jgi:Carboxypeptidase regulatory-like domain
MTKYTNILLGVFLLVSTAALAQNASVSGTVQDASGAAITEAFVSVTNLATAVERQVQTNGTGFYRIEPLAPGSYSINIEKAGFTEFSLDKITLTVDQKFTLNATLEVGAVSTKVEVNSSMIGQVDTETPTLSNVIEQKQMAELPMILRDPYTLVLLGPGVTQSDGMGGASVNGGRERNNNFQLDGVDNNYAEVPGNLGGVTSQNPDSTEEFRVLTNNFAPEYGRNNGAVIDVITKSGSNDLHGDAYYYGRWNALGARDYFNHQIDPQTGVVAPKDAYVRNLYGVSIGGPIAKGKTFFFLNYEGRRFITNRTNTSVVPTAAYKSGVFNYTNPQTGASQLLDVTDPNNASGQNGTGVGTGVGLDPVMQKILALYPKPNAVNSDGVSGLLFFPSESREKDENGTLKIDHALTKNNNISGRYTYNWYHDPNSDHGDFLPGNIGSDSSHQRTQGLAVSLISTPRATLSNDLRVGVNRLNLAFGCNGVSLFDSFGFVDGTGRGADYNLPGFSGFACFGDANGQSSKSGTFQVLDNVTKVVGTHTIKVGAEHRRVYSNNFTDFFSRQAFTFNTFSNNQSFPILNQANLSPGIENNTIEDLTAELLGLVNSASQTQFFNSAGTQLVDDRLGFRQREFGIFAQDVWKLRPNLSVTYGLRWEYYGVPFEQHNNLSDLFQDPGGVAPQLDANTTPGCDPTQPQFCTGFTFQTVGPGTGRQLYKDYYRNFEPRLGFAWDPFHDGRTSIRGGIGVFSDRVYGNLVSDARGDPPFQPSFFIEPASPKNGYGYTALGQLQNQTAAGPLTPSPIIFDFSAAFPDLFDHNMKPPRVVSWNFGVQREVGNLTLEANYVGNYGTRILRVIDRNPPQPNLVSQNLAACIASIGPNPPAPPSAEACQEDMTFINLYFGGAYTAPSTNNAAFYSTFTDQTTGQSYYNGLQVQATHRLSHGLQFSMAYTWSHAIDNTSDPLVQTRGNGNYPVSSTDLSRERGNSGFDTRQRAVLNFLYQIGVGRGRAYLNSGFLGRVLEGWEVSGIAQWQTGLPYDIFGPADTLHTSFADRATIVNPALLRVPSQGKVLPGGAGVFTGFNAGAFNPDDPTIMPVPWGIPSPSLRNSFYGPGINNWDMNLAKTTKITERVAFQLRFEVYNVFNRVHFSKPDNNIADTNFGYSTSQVGQNDGTTGARQIQVGAKLSF